MSKIENLTEEQIALFPYYVEKWTKIGLCVEPSNKIDAASGIEILYKVAGLKGPRVVWCSSPLANGLTRAIVIGVMKNISPGASIWDSVKASVRDSVWDSVKASVRNSVWASVGSSVRASIRASVWDSVGASIWDSVKTSIRDSIRASVEDSVWDSVDASVEDSVWASVGTSIRDSVGASVRNSVWASVGTSIRDSVGASVRNSVWYSVGASIYGQHDASWLGFYDYFHEVCGLKTETEKLRGYWLFSKNAGWALLHENICWVSERHNILNLDERDRLHKDGGLAIGYPDGWGVYAWHGTIIPAEWGAVRSEEWKPEWLLKTENAEHRRVLMEGLGYDRIVSALNSKKVHEDEDSEMELRRIDGIDVEPIQLLKVRCPSTGQTYVLRVPPEIEECDVARNWTFGDEPLAFIKET